jgi:hypothetical protein
MVAMNVRRLREAGMRVIRLPQYLLKTSATQLKLRSSVIASIRAVNNSLLRQITELLKGRSTGNKMFQLSFTA